MTTDNDGTDSNGGEQQDDESVLTVENSIRSAPTEELTSDIIQRASDQLEHSTARLHSGEIFNRQFRVHELVGHGGFCHVYRAEEMASGKIVALKFLRETGTATTILPRLQRELRLARDLGHPNIVKVHELIESEGQFCLVMDFVDGVTLKRVVTEKGRLPIDQAVEIMRDLVSAVAAVHAGGIVHRDLKPQNVMVSKSGDLILLDFGLARTTDSTGLTATGTILGTPDYMSPEQVNGIAADSRSDVYSLGIIAWELFVGKPPFSGDTPIAVALQHVRSRAPEVISQRADVPPEVSILVFRMTDPEPKNRPRSAEAVLWELEGSADGGLTSFMTPARRSTRRWLVAAATVALVVGAGLGGVAFLGSSAPVDPFVDGKIVATVQPRASLLSSSLERGMYLENVADAIPTLWTDPRVSLKKVDENLLSDPTAAKALGIEHLIEVSFLEDPGADSTTPRLKLRVFNTDDGSIWWESEIAGDFTMDYPGTVGISKNLADQYARQIDAAIQEATRAEAPGSS